MGMTRSTTFTKDMKQKLFILYVLCAGFMLFLSGIACAETISSTAELSNSRKIIAYMNSYPMMKSMYELAVEQDRKFGIQQNCTAQYHVLPYSLSVYQPIDFPDNKHHPTKGIWNCRYQIERCGETKFYNALFTVTGNGDTPPSSYANYPGNTNASPLLIRDAMSLALVNASFKSGHRDCKEIDVFDMQVIEPHHDVVAAGKTFKGVWKEKWIFRVCGKMVDVDISFVPDANGGGTTFSLGPLTDPNQPK